MKGAFSSVIVLLFFPFAIAATPFDNCPSNAFLIQGDPAGVIGVNLVSGTFTTLQSDLGRAERFNAGGFSVNGYYHGPHVNSTNARGWGSSKKS